MIKAATELYCAVAKAPFAQIGFCTDGERIVRIDYLPTDAVCVAPANALAREACAQLRTYLRDSRHVFDLPYAAQGTPFQQRVWRAIAAIPSANTRTYGELARMLGSAPRAVGGACGSNPVPLVIPCHRVVAAGGRLGGFMHSHSSFPLNIKRWLLQHEAH